jgi:hypothetical protein
MHLVIIILNLAVCTAALVTKTYNPLPSGGSCHFIRNPYGCDPSISGDCLRGRYAPIFTMTYYPVAMPCICIFFALWCLTTIVWHVMTQDRLFRTTQGVARVGSASREEIQLDRVARLLRRETILQVVLYVSTFLLTYGLPFVIAICNVTNYPVPDPIKCTTSAFFPLGGLFNILIYTRPQVVAFRRLHEGEYSWPRALWLVIQAGGENPDTVDSSTSPLLGCCLCGGRWRARGRNKYDVESLPSQLRYPALRSLVGVHRHKDDGQNGLEEDQSSSSLDSSLMNETGQLFRISIPPPSSSRDDGVADLCTSVVTSGHHDGQSATDPSR